MLRDHRCQMIGRDIRVSSSGEHLSHGSTEGNLEAFAQLSIDVLQSRLGKGGQDIAQWRFLSKAKVLIRILEWIEPWRIPKKAGVGSSLYPCFRKEI
jgi:hypothetical protein